MSDPSQEAQDVSVLGKRTWENGNDENGSEGPEPASKRSAVEEDSDDDVGPMPLPASASTTTKKKKKGACHHSYNMLSFS